MSSLSREERYDHANDAAPNGIWRAPGGPLSGYDDAGGGLSTRLRNALFVLFIGGILVYEAGFA